MTVGNNKLGLWNAVSLAVGTMIGASIFSIFGLGAKIAGQNPPFVFVISGLVALLVAYSYAWLGSRIVSDAGPMEFIIRAFGTNLLTRSLSFLFWFTYVISIALFAKGFAGYFLPLLPGPATPGVESIAVSGATDAAPVRYRAHRARPRRHPGSHPAGTHLTFERMQSYTIFRTVETIRILFFMGLDIVYDNFKNRQKPVCWDMHEVLVMASWLGLAGTLIAVYGFGLMTPIGWEWALGMWAYALTWFVFNDAVKMAVLRYYRKRRANVMI